MEIQTNKDKALVFDYGATLDTNGVHWYHIFAQEHKKHNSFLSEQQMRDAYVYGERTLSASHSVESMHDFKDTLLIKVGLQYDYLETQGIILSSMRHVEEIAESCYLFAKQNVMNVKPMLKDFSLGYKMALVSNFYGNLEEVLRDFEIREYFDIVVESAIVGISKPDKRLLQYALDKINVSPIDTIMIGDSYKKDIVPAKQLGCSTIWLKGKSWMGNPTNTPFADEIISDISDLKRIIV
ncbi:MAG: HAD family hydrolase [Bacteroidales bacterium]|nr:HAD family hydrolase [Bacteroidales bacterium]